MERQSFSSDLDIAVEMGRDKKTSMIFCSLKDIWRKRIPEK